MFSRRRCLPGRAPVRQRGLRHPPERGRLCHQLPCAAVRMCVCLIYLLHFLFANVTFIYNWKMKMSCLLIHKIYYLEMSHLLLFGKVLFIDLICLFKRVDSQLLIQFYSPPLFSRQSRGPYPFQHFCPHIPILTSHSQTRVQTTSQILIQP